MNPRVLPLRVLHFLMAVVFLLGKTSSVRRSVSCIAGMFSRRFLIGLLLNFLLPCHVFSAELQCIARERTTIAVSTATVLGAQRTHSYDAAGHVTSDGKRLYEWTSYGQRKFLQYTVGKVRCGFEFDPGGAVYTRTVENSATVTALAVVVKDHLGSTDGILTATWSGSSFTSHSLQRQSFDPWGRRREVTNQRVFRTSDTTAFRTSAQPLDRGYTGHEQLDDSGLIHMNGRIYDPELGRMLSPDPYVQVPEYSQNFNRYSYVMNNPLNLTDPSGYSWVGDLFSDVGSWLRENWRTVVVMVVVAVVTWGVGTAFVAAGSATFTTTVAGATSLNWAGMTATGAIAGAVGGGLNAGLNGGSTSDILRGALIGGIQGGISGGLLHGMGEVAQRAGFFSVETAQYIVGHGVVGGTANYAMSGKFGDGFVSAAAGAASVFAPGFNGNMVSRTVKAAVAGGTAAELGGGKFANGRGRRRSSIC